MWVIKVINCNLCYFIGNFPIIFDIGNQSLRMESRLFDSIKMYSKSNYKVPRGMSRTDRLREKERNTWEKDLV